MADVAATDTCPARKIPAIALFYTPSKEFVGTDTVQVEIDPGDSPVSHYDFLIVVQEADAK